MSGRQAATLLVGLIVVGTVASQPLLRTWTRNETGVHAWQAMARDSFDLTICSDVALLVHAQRMGCLLKAAAVGDSAVLARFDTASADLTTLETAMLRVSQAEVAWTSGDNQAACSLLTSIPADDEIRDFAERSSAANDWQAVATYVDCFAALRPRGDFADPYRAADLAYRLGTALDSAGQSEQATTAFQRAARWYPDIWSDSNVARAHLVGQNGEQLRSVASLRDELRRAADPRALFQSWRDQGAVSDPSLNLSLAVCAITQGDRCVFPHN